MNSFLKKTAAIFLTGLLFLPSGAMAAEKQSAYDRVVASGTLRCGYGVSPPNIVVDPNTGIVSGMDYDMWMEVGKELGLKIEFTEEAGWGNFIEGLKTGRYDAFCSMLWPDPARAKFLTLSRPVLFSFLDTYTRAGDTRFDGNLDRINAPDILVPGIEGDISSTMTQNRFPQTKIYSLPQTATLSDLFIAVTTKKADLMFLDQAMVDHLEENNKGALRKVENVPHAYVFASYFGYGVGEYQLRDMVDLALRTMINDGRMEKIAHKYSKDYIVPTKDY